MEKEELLKKYCEIENKIIPIVNLLEREKDSVYKGSYKGIITLQSSLMFNPEILFIGINPGAGAYNRLNQGKNPKNVTPLWMTDNEKMHFEELSWLEEGSARGYFKNPKKKEGWESFKWYQRNQKVNNPFPKNMIDLLFEIAKLKYPNDYKSEKYDDNKVPFWYKDFGQKIMCTSLYPIATINTTDLKEIHEKLAKESELQKYWEESKGKDPSINEWVVRKYFIRRAYELIKLVQPKVIVFIGKSACNDFLYGKCKGKIHSQNIMIDNKSIPLVGFSRRGQWSSRIPEIAKEIIKIESPITL